LSRKKRKSKGKRASSSGKSSSTSADEEAPKRAPEETPAKEEALPPALGFRLTEEQELESARRSRVLPLLIILAIHAVFIALAYNLAGGNSPIPKFYAFDAVALPGETVAIKVNVSHDIPPLLSQDEEKWELRLEGPGIAEHVSARTAPNHPVEFEVVAPKDAGVHEYEVQAIPTEGGTTAVFPVYLQVIPADRPIILTTVRGTLTSGIAVRGEEDRGGPNPRIHAKETLDRLAKDHAIVYIEHSPPRDLPWAADWIRHHELPEGAVLLSRHSDRPADELIKPRMIELLRTQIAERWSRVRYAFAAKDDATSAFSAAGIPTIYIGATPKDEPTTPPPGGASIKAAQSWARADDITK